MGLIRLVLGAGVVAAVVMAGEADTRQETLKEAMDTAATVKSTASAAVEFCRQQPVVCAAAASAGATATLGTRTVSGKTAAETPVPAKDRKRAAASATRESPSAGK